MGQFTVYTCISGLVLLASYIIYKWLLARENQPAFNRVVLLSVYVLSFLALPISDAIASCLPHAAADITLGDATAAISADAYAGLSVSNATVVVLWTYLAGMIVTALWTLAVTIRIFCIIATGKKHKFDRYTLVLVDRHYLAPFSWGNYIVMSDNEDEEAARMILCHERAHIECFHFADLLLAQIVCILLWYNPAAWLMLSELKSVHEYQADSHVLASGVNCRQYQLLLIKKAVGVRFPSLANSLNHSKLKKRITMMYNQKTSPVRRTRALAIVPAVALTLVLVNIPSVSNAFERTAAVGLYTPAAEIDSKVTKTLLAVQAATPDETDGASDEQNPDKLPQFEGGELMLMNYLMYNVKYPEEAQKAGAEGKVVVKFTVKSDGNIADVSVQKPIHPALDAEAIRVVESMKSRWQAGEKDGKKVNCTFALPISFKLGKDNASK